jgi:hypothetical protein
VWRLLESRGSRRAIAEPPGSAGDDEATRPTEHPDVMEVLSPTMVTQTELDFIVDKLQNLALEQRSTELIRLLRKAARQPGPNAERSPSARVDRSEGTESRERGERAPRSTDPPSG